MALVVMEKFLDCLDNRVESLVTAFTASKDDLTDQFVGN